MFFMHKILYVHGDTYMNTLYIKYVGCTYTLANNTNIRLFKGVNLNFQYKLHSKLHKHISWVLF